MAVQLNLNLLLSFSQTEFRTAAPLPSCGPAFPPVQNPAQTIQLLQQLMHSLSQLTSGWQGLLTRPPGPACPPAPTPQLNSPAPNLYGGGGGRYTGPNNFIPQGQQFHYDRPGYQGVPGRLMAYPTDRNEFASYLQAQKAGGALNGQTTVRQRDAIPGTRFGTVQNSQAWNASVGRSYAYQFAAYAMAKDPLSPQGLQYAADNFDRMSPDAKLFTQVASVFKGNLLGGPGNYDNPGLKKLLLQRGLGQFANAPGVGQTDVQTIGAITQALNSGRLSLQDVINSGTINNMNRYQQVIRYVQGGQFNNDLHFFDTTAR